MNLAGVFVSCLVSFIVLCLLGFHKVEEGHIAIYYFGGVLQNKYSEAGFNWALPILNKVENVQITLQTDEVNEIPCGTSGGVMIQFEKIEVVNRLKKEQAVETIRNYTALYDRLWIYDKIHHEINQFCSQHTLQEIYIDQFENLDEQLMQRLQRDLVQWAPGIEIVAIRVTKPKIPDSVKKKFEEMEQQRTNFLLESEKQSGVQAGIKAQSELEVAQISIEREINEKLSQYKLAEIEDQMLYKSEIAKIDSLISSQKIELQTVQMRLTKEYLEIQAIKALTNNTIFYIGDKIPQSLGGGLGIIKPQN